jgi:hypothetical protein
MFQQDRILVNWAANAHDRVFHRYRWFLFLIDPFSVFSTLARSEPPNKIQLVSARLRLIVEAAVRTPPAKLPRRAHSRPAAARRDARVYHGLNVSFHRRRMTSSQLGRRSGVRPVRMRGQRRRTRPKPASRHHHDAAKQLPRTGHSGLPMSVANARHRKRLALPITAV